MKMCPPGSKSHFKLISDIENCPSRLNMPKKELKTDQIKTTVKKLKNRCQKKAM